MWDLIFFLKIYDLEEGRGRWWIQKQWFKVKMEEWGKDEDEDEEGLGAKNEAGRTRTIGRRG